MKLTEWKRKSTFLLLFAAALICILTAGGKTAFAETVLKASAITPPTLMLSDDTIIDLDKDITLESITDSTNSYKLTIRGSGKLTIESKVNMSPLQCKDIILQSGTVEITDPEGLTPEAIYTSGDFTMTGGSLIIKMSENGSGDRYGLVSNGDVTISGGAVTISSYNHAIQCAKNMKVENAVLNLSSDYSCGIFVTSSDSECIFTNSTINIASYEECLLTNGSLSCTSCTLAYNSDEDDGIYAYKAITMSESTVEISAYDYGIYCNDTNSDITFTNCNLTIEADDCSGIYGNDGSLTCSGSTLYIITPDDDGLYAYNDFVISNNCDIHIESDENGIYVSSGNLEIKDSNLDIDAADNDAIESYGNDVTIENTSGKLTGRYDGICAKNNILINKCSLDIKGTGSEDAIYSSNGQLTVKDSEINATCKGGDGFDIDSDILIKGGKLNVSCRDKSLDAGNTLTIEDAVVTAESKYDYAVYAYNELIIKGSTLTANVTKRKVPAVNVLKCTLPDDLCVKTPAYGILKAFDSGTYSGRTCVTNSAGKIAYKAVIAPRTLLKELHFTIPQPEEGKDITRDFTVKTVPEGAVNEKAIQDIINAQPIKDLWKEAADGKTYADPAGGKFAGGATYASIIPGSVSLMVMFDISDTEQSGLYDRDVIQGMDPANTIVTINGVNANDIEHLEGALTPFVVIGKCPFDLSKAAVTAIADQEYTGSALTPALEVKRDSAVLKAGTDYTAEYASNTNIGKASVTLTGKGNYAGKLTANFNIVHTKHVSDEGKVTKEPTVKEEGEKTYSCTICKEVLKKEAIPKLEEPATTAAAEDKTTAAAEDKAAAVEKAPKLSAVEKKVLKLTGYKDPADSKFGVLRAKAKKITNTSVTLGWTKVKGANGYVIYGNKCGKKTKYLKLATIKKGSTTSKKITKIKKTKLKKGTYYKFIVVATAKDAKGATKAIATSKSVHFITTGNKKYGDYTKVKLSSKSKVTVKVGKTSKIKASQVKPKKLKVQEHRGLKYESGNTAVATVSSKGVIKGKKKGKATIYIYAQNGVYATVTVTVK